MMPDTAIAHPDLTPPHNTEAEQALLGAILVNNKALEKVADFLRPEHFFDPANGRIYAAAARMIAAGRMANPLTLRDALGADAGLDAAGGPEYLAHLASCVVTLAHADDYGRMIRDAALRRELLDIADELRVGAFDRAGGPAEQVIEAAEGRLFAAAESGQTQGRTVSLAEAMQATMERAQEAARNPGAVTGITTGLTDLDRLLGGLRDTDLVIIAGRPSMGKTALAINMAMAAVRAHARGGAAKGAPVAFFSLEQSADQIAGRILADLSGIPGEDIDRGNLDAACFRRLAQAQADFASLPLHIDETPAIAPELLRLRARRMVRTHKVGMIVVDYLQLMRSARRTENRTQEVTEITGALKAIAKELHVPVIALSQLSRQVESREDKRPMLSDLRESGSIEQDADVIIFPYREEYYLSRTEPGQRPGEDDGKFNDRYQNWEAALSKAQGTADIIVAKNRHGRIGTVRAAFDGPRFRFSDLDTNHTGGWE